MKCKCKCNVNEHVNLHVAFLATYFTKKLQQIDPGRKIDLGRKIQLF